MTQKFRLGFLGVVLTLNLMMIGCTSSEEKTAYQPLDLTEVQGELIGDAPQTITKDLFGNKEPIEGNYTEEIKVIKEEGFEQVLTFTQMNLPDDSVKGIRYRLNFEFDQSIGKWRLVEGGRQFSCRRGETSTEWTGELCP